MLMWHPPCQTWGTTSAMRWGRRATGGATSCLVDCASSALFSIEVDVTWCAILLQPACSILLHACTLTLCHGLPALLCSHNYKVQNHTFMPLVLRAHRHCIACPSNSPSIFRATCHPPRQLLAIASLDGLVEASRQSRVCGGAANDVQCMIFKVGAVCGCVWLGTNP